MAIWMLWQTGFSSLSLQLSPPAATAGATARVMANASMLIVPYFAVLRLTFGDFARFGRDEATMKKGNLLGLPLNFLVFSIITVIVTAGTFKVFGQVLSVLVCPWLFAASTQAIILFVSIFGSVLGRLFGIMIADYFSYLGLSGRRRSRQLLPTGE